MSSAVEQYVIYQIANAPLREHPFPHLYVESVFPDEFYRAMRSHWPGSSSLISLAKTGRVTAGAYPDRFIMAFRPPEIEKLPQGQREFWSGLHSWFMGESFLRALLQKFGPQIQKRFGDTIGRYSFGVDSLIVRDRVNYQLGPHTDAPHKLLSLLFYCPDDDSMKDLGTTIYVPIDPGFRCPGVQHYQNDMFNKVRTMEYRPNSLFAFFKTDNSFHGVEPITDTGVLRDLLLYDVRVHGGAEAAVAPAAPGTGWRMLKKMFGMGS
jgi:hypothetical protein